MPDVKVRNWKDGEKALLLETEATRDQAGGANGPAGRRECYPGLLYRWRQVFRSGARLRARAGTRGTGCGCHRYRSRIHAARFQADYGCRGVAAAGARPEEAEG